MTRKQKHKVYTSKRWRRIRAIQLNNEPLCQCCEQGHHICTSGMKVKDKQKVDGYNQTRIVPGYVVDHKIPLDIRPDLAYSLSNLTTLCSSCNTRKGNVSDHYAKKQERINNTHNELENWN